MYTHILQKLGLSANEAKLYELLLLKGESKASDLVPDSGLGRGNVYNLLTALVSRGLATVTAGKLQIYRAAEPTKLASLVEAKRLETDRLEAEFKAELPKLTSTFNLTTGRPAIQVFEGPEGFKEVLEDSLAATNGIMTFLDTAAVIGVIAEINRGYLKQRVAKKIIKRLILPDSQASRDFIAAQSTPYTEVVYLKDFPAGFKTATEVYNNKVSYLTLRPNKLISVLIEDENIAALHRAQFEYFWQLGGGKPMSLIEVPSVHPDDSQTPLSAD
ncbi:MAG: helix-turn-helix domain-containing protein [Patescibacteria group bacterium]